MSKQASLKDQLKDFLSNPDKKRTKITVEVVRGKQAMLSDSNRYFLASKNFEKELKKDKVKKEKFYANLKKWKFVQNKKNQVEIEVYSYNIANKKGDDLHQKNKNLLEYSEIKNLLEQKVSQSQKTDTKKSAKNTPSKRKSVAKSIQSKKKIKKITSDSQKVEKSLKSRKQTPKQTPRKIQNKTPKKTPKQTPKKIQNKTPKKTPGKKQVQQQQRLALKGLSSSNEYTAAELIFARDFDTQKRPASVSVQRQLTVPKEFRTLNINFEQQLAMNREQNLNYDKQLQRTRQTSNIKITDDKIPPSLKNQPMTYAEIIHGIQKGLISWSEINVNYQVISKILM